MRIRYSGRPIPSSVTAACVDFGMTKRQMHTRETVAKLLRLAQTTDDPKLAGVLIQKTADLKDRIDDQSSSKRNMTCKAPDGQSDVSSWRSPYGRNNPACRM
jgi:hypothetical protein